MDKKLVEEHFLIYVDPIIKDLDYMIKIKDRLNAPIVLVVFSLIDALGKCIYGRDTNQGISLFLRGYMVKVDGRYSQHAVVLEKVFRNGLAHTGVPYPGGGVARNREDIHLTIKTTREGACIVVDADTFYKHFKKAMELYKKDLLSKEDRYNKFRDWIDWLRENPPEEIGNYLREQNLQASWTPEITGATPFFYPIDQLEMP